MSFSDPIGDLLTRIRNAQMRFKSTLTCPFSKIKVNVLDVLKREGYINNYTNVEISQGIQQVKIELKYHEGQPVIHEIKRVSKPGRRVYSAIGDLQRVSNGLGISILSTPKGVLSDDEARRENVGGEIICTVV